MFIINWKEMETCPNFGFQVSLVVKNMPANAGDIRDSDSGPGSGRSPGGRNSNHSSILAGKSHGQRSLAATVDGVAESWT